MKFFRKFKHLKALRNITFFWLLADILFVIFDIIPKDEATKEALKRIGLYGFSVQAIVFTIPAIFMFYGIYCIFKKELKKAKKENILRKKEAAASELLADDILKDHGIDLKDFENGR